MPPGPSSRRPSGTKKAPAARPRASRPAPRPQGKSVPKSAPRPRRPISWSRLAWGALVLNLAAGLMASQATSLQSVRVVGLPDGTKTKALEKAVEPLQGVPFMRADSSISEALVLQMPEVESAKLERTLFGRGLLKIEWAEPVAKIEGADAVLTRSGRIVYGLPAPEGIMTLGLESAQTTAVPGFIGPYPTLELARLVDRIGRAMPGEDWALAMDRAGIISISKPEGVKLIFGAPDDWDQKWKAWERLITSEPTLPDQRVIVNVTAPDWPTKRPRPAEPKKKS